MPYRIDLLNPPDAALDRLVELGALDVEPIPNGIAAIIPDGITPATVARAVGVDDVRVVPTRGRDAGSIWIVSPRAVRTACVQIVPADWPAGSGVLRMIDGPAFGTGLHPTTALCLEALHDELTGSVPPRALDVGTGSGVLALAALSCGVPRVVAVDIDNDAVRVAAGNARLNGVSSRLLLVRGGPEALAGSWPLVLANLLAAPLIEMAPVLTRRVGRSGRLILSGIRSSVGADVEQAYRRLGMRQVRTGARDGWTALTLHASW
jgi:ribosomal protein L11 methylase PrmA